MNAIERLEVLLKVDELQNRYIVALDGKDMDGWLSTFVDSEDASYYCISAENEENNFPICLMLDDCRARLKDRIIFINQIWKGTFQDYRTRHFLQRLSCEQESDNTYRVRTNFSIDYTFDPHPTAVLASGVYEDLITIEGDDARFLEKRAIYDTTVLPQYIVYPF